AEDGIGGPLVTGVQTCALPIFLEALVPPRPHEHGVDRARALPAAAVRLVLEAQTHAVDERLVLGLPLPEDRGQVAGVAEGARLRSEERRGGREGMFSCRSCFEV